MLAFFAVSEPLGFAVMVSTTGAAVIFVITLLFSPQTRGKELAPHLTLVEHAA